MLSVTDSGGKVTYGYNADGENSSVTDPNSNQTTFAFDADGNETSETNPNGVTQGMTYDLSDHETGVTARYGSSTLESRSYVYSNGRASSQTDNVTGYTTAFTYDAGGRLTDAVTKTGGGAQVSNYPYAYDSAGNITSMYVGGAQESLSYNKAGEISSTGFSYDNAGNMTAGSGGLTASYNSGEQTANLDSVSQTYLGSGQSAWVASGTTSYEPIDVSCGDGSLPGSATTGGVTTYLLQTSGGQPISQRSGSGTYYYLFDGLGNVIGLTNNSGAVAAAYAYDPYGNVTSGPVSSLVTWNASIYDASAGLYKFGDRFYDPRTGSFTQTDPSGPGKGGSLHQYAGDDPVDGTDLSGDHSRTRGSWSFGAGYWCMTRSLWRGWSEMLTYISPAALFLGAAVSVPHDLHVAASVLESSEAAAKAASRTGWAALVLFAVSALGWGPKADIDSNAFKCRTGACMHFGIGWTGCVFGVCPICENRL